MKKFDISKVGKLDSAKRREAMPPLETLTKFGIKNPATFLDIGSGTGYFTLAAAEILKDGKVIGVDISDGMLELAAEKSQRIDNVEYRKCGEYSFPVDDESVDYAFISNVLHEVEDKVKYLTEVRRVIKIGGYLCIIEWKKEAMNDGPPLKERVSAEDIKELAGSANMQFVEEIIINDGHYGIKLKAI